MSEKIFAHFKEYTEIHTLLVESGRADLSISYSNTFAKTFTLLCCSYFESEITRILKTFIENNSLHSGVKELLIRKALKRQYHTLFDWNTESIEHFLGLFGDDFRKDVKNRLRDNDAVVNAIKNFMRLGKYRNEITHQNIISYTYDQTPSDVLYMFKNALNMLEFFEEIFEINNNGI